MSQIGRILNNDPDALHDGPPVTAMLIQNTNPAAVAPEQTRVLEGFAREDLFVCVHEQFMTDTARYADVVLPATTFLEHPDVYTSYGHTFLQVAKPVVARHGQARSNHEVLQGLATRLGAKHEGFTLDAWSVVDRTLRASGYPGADALHDMRWYDANAEDGQVDLRQAFPTGDGRFHFRPNWEAIGLEHDRMPTGFGHWQTNDYAHPFRLIAGPARHFLNSSFSETPTSAARQGRPTVKLHPDDARDVGVQSGAVVRLGNARGSVRLHAEITNEVRPSVVVVESIWPNAAFLDGQGINVLTSADRVPPAGGAAFHDTSVWIRADAP